MNKAHETEATRVEDFKTLQVTSPAFGENEMIPSRFSRDGINVNPGLDITQIPTEAKSLAIIVDDPDAPGGTFCHWAVWNIPVTHHIREKETRGVTGLTDYPSLQYDGPCPPSGTHRYFFKVYALDDVLDLPSGSGMKELEKAMSDHILAFGSLMGKYKRKEKE